MVNYKKGGRRAPMANPVKLAKPGDMDILCGKDRACALHKGSQRFRAVIDSYRASYQKATTKYDKMQITKEIYEVLSQKSRFLKFVPSENVWEEITPLAGRDKIGHALRFANNNQTAVKPKKKPRKTAIKRQGSFSSASADDSAPGATKAELVASLVEAVKEEPKVWDTIVDHLTLQDVLTSVPSGVETSGESVEEAKAHQAVANAITDPVALENIAYAVDTKTDDAALDELITLLNNDEIVSEEDIHDVLAIAESKIHPAEVPSSVSFNVHSSLPSMAEDESEHHSYLMPTEGVPAVASHPGHIRRASAGSFMLHKRGFSADDDMWSVMKEPLMDLDWQ